MKKSAVKLKTIKLNLQEILLLLVVLFSSVLSGLLLLFDDTRPSYYGWLPMLPLSFGLINVVFFPIYNNLKKKIGYLIIIFLYGVRNMITPLFMRFGNYSGLFNNLSYNNVNKAILLMIYETAIIFLFLFLVELKIINLKKPCIKTRTLSFKNNQFFKFIIIILTLICVVSYFVVPEIKLNYTSIFDANELVSGLIVRKGLPNEFIHRVLFTLFTFVFNIIQILLSIWLIIIIRRKFGSSKFGVICSLIVMFSQLLFMTDENAYTLIILLVIGIVLYQQFKKQKKMLISIVVIGGIIAVLVLYFAKVAISNNFYSEKGVESLSKMLQLYFPGVGSLASVFNINNFDKQSTLFFDIYHMIPFRQSIFGLDGYKLVDLFTIQNSAPFQILPAIGQSYHYFGFIFAPFIPCFFVYISVKYQNVFNDISDPWKQSSYGLLCIFAAITPIMYNATIFGARYFNTLLPIIILSSFSTDSTEKIIKG